MASGHAGVLDRPMRHAPGPAVPEQPPVRRTVGAAVATIAIVLVLSEAVADALPDDPIRFNVTPVRLAIILGLVGICFAGVMVRSLRTRLDVPILVLLAAAGFATLVHSQSFSAWRGLLAGVAAYYLAVGARRGGALSFGTLATIALVFVAVPAGVALGQASNQTSTGFCRSGLGGELSNVCNDDAMVRVVGTFYNPNLLAAFLVMFVPLAVVGALGVADRSLRALAFTVIGGSYIAILATFSRGGMAAAFVGAVVLVVLLKPTRRRLTVAGVAAGVGGLLLVFLMVVRGGVGVRTEVWSAALRVAAENPLGTGLGLSGHLVAGRVPGTEAFVHVHNLWLNWLVETGVVGGVAVVVITVLVGIRVGRAALAGSKMAAALAGGLASFAVVSMVDHPANSMAISLVMWLMLGLAETSWEPSPLPAAIRHKGRRAARRTRVRRS
ncbi:O-antigen ligase family protein [Nocardioides speluncae]|uniref:O-antigen ligase family protein n=1 Tax=Nocardioides speluncae TaxID=2670337 RepID=UPI0012B18691|nr:O-antigen ligase family protein [Nocardioides speluncae]